MTIYVHERAPIILLPLLFPLNQAGLPTYLLKQLFLSYSSKHMNDKGNRLDRKDRLFKSQDRKDGKRETVS